MFRARMQDTHGHFLLTVTPIDDPTKLQLWHFRKVVVPTFRKLSIENGELITDDEAELILLHQVCKINEEKKLEDLTKEEIGTVIDHCKRWINDFFGDTMKEGQRKHI